MTDRPDIVEIARRFAGALDQDNYEIARALLADDCGYEGPAKAVIGPEAIVSSYRDHSAMAQRLFDAVEYRSETTRMSVDTVSIAFFDSIAIRGQRHVYRCRQRLHFRPDGLIDCIRHEELPGERERLLRFCAEYGVSLDHAAVENPL
jgi:hypothetical protein